MDFAAPFGPWLKARRKQLDLTQVELARRAHYAPVSLRRIEERGLPASRALASALIAPLEVPESERDAFVVHPPLRHE